MAINKFRESLILLYSLDAPDFFAGPYRVARFSLLSDPKRISRFLYGPTKLSLKPRSNPGPFRAP